MFSKLSRYLASALLLGAFLSAPAMAKNYVVEVHGIKRLSNMLFLAKWL